MTDYPEDILRAAEELADDVICAADPYRSELVEMFAAALAAERERATQAECVRMHEQVIADIDHAHENWKGIVLMKLRRQYAVSLTAIRGEKP